MPRSYCDRRCIPWPSGSPRVPPLAIGDATACTVRGQRDSAAWWCDLQGVAPGTWTQGLECESAPCRAPDKSRHASVRRRRVQISRRREGGGKLIVAWVSVRRGCVSPGVQSHRPGFRSAAKRNGMGVTTSRLTPFASPAAFSDLANEVEFPDGGPTGRSSSETGCRLAVPA